LTCQLRKGFFDFLFVGVGHPRTEVELGYTFGVPVALPWPILSLEREL
jgi:hypothetical protein